jgi:hypothetical protein
LDQETTSFFFTNVPEEAQVVELWSLFAKHGRVGEVYIPKKRDKWGNRFGFVKYKEVKSVEALSSRLEDVWVGTYKLRVNLSRFSRKKTPTTVDSGKKPTQHGVTEESSKRPQPFKQALLNGRVEQSSSMIATVEVGVVQDFLHSLEGSYVGRLGEGVELRALQTKLWLAGFPLIKITTMGGELVLISHYRGEEIHGPFCKKGWWGGLLFDIRRWTPNLVSSKRLLWVNMFGVPPHAWGESTFLTLANRCGRYISMDANTKNRNRLDVARVKIEAPILGFVDHIMKLVVHGAAFQVRIVEEGGRNLEFDESEDQLQGGDAISSCASGGKAAAVVGLDDLDGSDTESEASEVGQRGVPVVVQMAKKSMTDKGDVGIKTVGSSGMARVIPSTGSFLKATDEEVLTNRFDPLRGDFSMDDVEPSENVAVGQDLSAENDVGTRNDFLIQVGPDPGKSRPVMMDQGKGLDPSQKLGLIRSLSPIGEAVNIGPLLQVTRMVITAGPVIGALDNLILQTRAKAAGNTKSSNLSEVGSLESSSNPDPSQKGNKQSLGKIAKHPKSLVNMSTLLGPKCLRFAEMVNNSSGLLKKRRNGEVNDSVNSQASPTPLVAPGSSVFMEDSKSHTTVHSSSSDENPDVVPATIFPEERPHSPPGMVLEVVLPFHCETRAQSGVDLLLCEDSIHNVEGFITGRENPEAKFLEAQRLLVEQETVGFNFDQREAAPIGRMVDMEVRDRVEFSKNQETTRPQ